MYTLCPIHRQVDDPAKNEKKKKKKNGAESGIWLYSVSNVTDQSRVHCSDTHTHTYTKHKDHAYHMPLISMHPSKTARKGLSASTIPQMCPTPVAIHLTIISSPRFLIKKLAGAPQQVIKKINKRNYILEDDAHITPAPKYIILTSQLNGKTRPKATHVQLSNKAS